MAGSKGTAGARLAAPLILGAVALLTGAARAQAYDVTVLVKDGSAVQRYTATWADRMTVLDAMRQSLPTSPDGSFALKYFPLYDGSIVTSVAGKPAPGSNGYWSTCLLPAGPGSTEITLPLGPDRIIVGPSDTVSLVFNAPCGSGAPAH